MQTLFRESLIRSCFNNCAAHMKENDKMIIYHRLFGPEDEETQETDSVGAEVMMPVQPFPSYAATAALPASGPVTATLTG